MRSLHILILGIVFSLSAFGGQYSSGYSADPDGLPLPWPFPWAKECPVQWQDLEGRYVLSGATQKEQIELEITVVRELGFNFIHLIHYSEEGYILADGYEKVEEGERMINITLRTKGSKKVIPALLKLHYHNDWDFSCSADNLVPILTLDQESNHSHRQSDYRLVRIR